MVTININTDNAAFHDADGKPDVYFQTQEVVRILRKLCDRVEYAMINQGLHTYTQPLLDINGNEVGDFVMELPGRVDDGDGDSDDEAGSEEI